MQKDCAMSTTDLTFAYITYFPFFYLLANEEPCETLKIKLFATKKVANQGLFYPFTVPISNNALFENRNALSKNILGQFYRVFYGVLSAVNLGK